MIKSDQIQVWNLTDGKVVRSGSVDIFNIVGRIADPATVEKFSYRLNDGPETPVFFSGATEPVPRLSQPGDFNIDTISLADLAAENRISFRIKRAGGSEYSESIRFRSAPFEQTEPSFRLDLDGASGAEEVGQVVEGPWRVGKDEQGRRCLEIVPEDAGYDRIILFGRENWSSSYEIGARLTVTHIVDHHNIGLVFRWNPHERGDGTWLPTKWSSGLAYYCSYAKRPGIRIRFGVRAHYDEAGKAQGEYLLADCPLATRWQVLFNRIKRKARLARWTTEFGVGRDYCFRMRVQPRRLALTVWLADHEEPPPQLVVDDPIEPLRQGAVGILAYHVGVRLYEFEVRPLSDDSDQPATASGREQELMASELVK